MYSQGSNYYYTSIGSDDVLGPNRRQAVTWTNVAIVYWRIYASLGPSGLKTMYFTWWHLATIRVSCYLLDNSQMCLNIGPRMWHHLVLIIQISFIELSQLVPFQWVNSVDSLKGYQFICVINAATMPCPLTLAATQANLLVIWVIHYNDVGMGAIASQITSLTIAYSIVYSDTDQRKHQSSASLAFVWGIHRGPVNSPHKWSVTRKMFPFDDKILSILASPYSCKHVNAMNHVTNRYILSYVYFA